jgi:anti-sigma factor ChrR (cupin superfamily)
MGSISGSDFRKKWHCPSAEALVSYHRSLLANLQSSRITAHLAMCDFCAAELQLLSKVPLAEHCSETPQMPEHLRALAEALLTSDSFRQRSTVQVDKQDRHV